MDSSFFFFFLIFFFFSLGLFSAADAAAGGNLSMDRLIFTIHEECEHCSRFVEIISWDVFKATARFILLASMAAAMFYRALWPLVTPAVVSMLAA